MFRNSLSLLIPCFLLFAVGSVAVAEGEAVSPPSEEASERRERLAEHETLVQLDAIERRICRGLTSRCPNHCGHSGKFAMFRIVKYLRYEKLGEFGDPQQTEFLWQISDLSGTPLVDAERYTAITGMQRGGYALLSWNHDLVANQQGSGPDRPIVKFEAISNERAQQLMQETSVELAAESFVAAFNSGNADAVSALFLPTGELTDEAGQTYQGIEELRGLFTRYFAAFPGAQVVREVESLRHVSDTSAVEDGTRQFTAPGLEPVRVRYNATWTKSDGQWLLASVREIGQEEIGGEMQAVDTANSRPLDSLAWLEGEWVGEDPEFAVTASYRWTDEHTFMIGSFDLVVAGKVVMTTTQRIGWDAATRRIRSWLFDSDGGFAEATWANVDGSWIIKSTATLPDGSIGSATVSLLPDGEDRFTMTGRDRLLGDQQLDDFGLIITRAPPAILESTQP